MFGWKFCSKFNFIMVFPSLTNFADFLDHTNNIADVSRNDCLLKVKLYIFIKYINEILVA